MRESKACASERRIDGGAADEKRRIKLMGVLTMCNCGLCGAAKAFPAKHVSAH